MQVIVIHKVESQVEEVSLLDIETGEYTFLDTMEAVVSGDITLGWVVGDDAEDTEDAAALSQVIHSSKSDALRALVWRHAKGVL